MEQCDYPIKVSELVDGELSFEESERITLHLESCPVCRDAQESFLLSRAQLRSYESVTDDRVRERVLASAVDDRDTLFWQRSLRVPFPAAAAATIVFIALILWSAVAGVRQVGTGNRSVMRVTPLAADETGKNAPGGSDLARFDRGDRLVIYKEARPHERDHVR
jgi:anti-sigma factor RsiW